MNDIALNLHDRFRGSSWPWADIIAQPTSWLFATSARTLSVDFLPFKKKHLVEQPPK